MIFFLWKGRRFLLLKDKSIVIEIKRQNVNHYKDRGYNCKVGDIVEVNINDLPIKSKIKITVICDYCGKEKDIPYCNYVKSISGIIHKYACNHCIGLKIKESNLIVYGVDSVMKLEKNKNKLQKTMMNKYGVKSPAQSKDVINKMKNTMIERYGADNSMHIEKFKNKQKRTLFNNYGVDSPLHNDLLKEKAYNTNMKKYGVSNPFQNKDIQEKQKQTCVEKYGCENVFQNEDIKKKSKLTMIKKYNSDHPMHIKEIKDKVIEKGLKTKYKYGTVSCSKQQKYIHNLIGGELNFPIDKLSLDIAFPKDKIYIEYNGSGHDIDVKYGRISKKDFQEKEIKRYQYLKSLGWKQIEINSFDDSLLIDELFVNLIEESKIELCNSKINHITINIQDYDSKYKFKLPREYCS